MSDYIKCTKEIDLTKHEKSRPSAMEVISTEMKEKTLHVIDDQDEVSSTIDDLSPKKDIPRRERYLSSSQDENDIETERILLRVTDCIVLSSGSESDFCLEDNSSVHIISPTDENINNLPDIIPDDNSSENDESHFEDLLSSSPIMEPVSKYEYCNNKCKLKNGCNNDEKNKQSDSSAHDEELLVTKKRKINEPVKTYTNRKLGQSKTIDTISISSDELLEQKKEKKLHFENECKLFYRKVLKFKPAEIELLSPVVKVQKSDLFKLIPNLKNHIKDLPHINEKEIAEEESDEQIDTDDKMKHPYDIKNLYGNAPRDKQILERQDFVKSKEGKPMVLVTKRQQVSKRTTSAAKSSKKDVSQSSEDRINVSENRFGEEKDVGEEVEEITDVENM